MIDESALQRDVTAHIADWPVNIRHYYDPDNDTLFHQTTAGLNTTDDISDLLEGGLLDKPDADIIALASTLNPLPKNRDRVDVQMADGTWHRFEVKRMPDIYNPLGPDIQFHIGSPNV